MVRSTFRHFHHADLARESLRCGELDRVGQRTGLSSVQDRDAGCDLGVRPEISDVPALGLSLATLVAAATTVQ